MLVLLCAAISGSAQAEAAEWRSVDVGTAGGLAKSPSDPAVAIRGYVST
jgi:hypothetical protein